ncbi:uroporphyrinogen-III C-methyltransferase [Blastochloris sulfoviridis]|uniref:uroporphyrinogen-III C-methyltransferase n=1 Tax=Blastochloris sulfoviridis TaxID=50712 RepID=A0A5M6HK57_9HYPH|nr:uroporphyrinogen-III C-methyltransferase [Blastochloris sulfoviridis]KAA5596263.1 uroporphyrinogen-III C-methyltransferase [Blastochloris sulfoviridis]
MSQISSDGRGRIALVGAGPGDPDLLTLRALERIREADVILYDDLASGPVLEAARPDAELIPVGKRAGRPSHKQADVTRQMIAHAVAGRRVVRLKSGDPTLFGRADEEIAAARDAGIPLEIVPGVTSATAAAAHVGVSLSKRIVARRVQMVTGHDVDARLPDLDIAALADPEATTCVFMGKGTFAELVEKLLAHGMAADTPAVVVESLGTPAIEVMRGSIIEIAGRLAAAPPSGPCMILYGRALAEPDDSSLSG